eukprot:726433_1
MDPSSRSSPTGPVLHSTSNKFAPEHGDMTDCVTVHTSDGMETEVEREIIIRCGIVRKRLSLGDVNKDGSITLHSITKSALELVLDYCRFEWPGDFHTPPVFNKHRSREDNLSLLHQHSAGAYPRGLGYGGRQAVRFRADRPTASGHYEAFLEKADPEVLCELSSAAYYLEVKPLVDLTCRSIADIIKGKSTAEIRSAFCIENDFTPGEEIKVRKSILQETLFLPSTAQEAAGSAFKVRAQELTGRR